MEKIATPAGLAAGTARGHRRVLKLHLALTLVSFSLLIPGVTLPVYGVAITTSVDAEIIPEPVEATLYQQTRSILGAVQDLWRSGDRLVSFLILFFSILVPVLKSSALLGSLYAGRDEVRTRLVWLVDRIGKWSMADVFVVAVFLAFLATRDQTQASAFTVPILFQQVDVSMATHVTSTLGPGFYFFLAYCLSSIFVTQVLSARASARPGPGSTTTEGSRT